ncbi:hypothetical protein [Microbulbifer sp. PAAF003]|uniref:hypothetical protein n=1 Tax=Microbulbifer sp. PAAF003 TaxID=3243375 RepID=UPI0040392812
MGLNLPVCEKDFQRQNQARTTTQSKPRLIAALNVMANLRKTTESNVIGGREYWDLENRLEVVTTIEDEPCCISIANKDNLFTQMLSKYLEAKSIEHTLTSTIDSCFIEVSLALKPKAIEVIESWAW